MIFLKNRMCQVQYGIVSNKISLYASSFLLQILFFFSFFYDLLHVCLLNFQESFPNLGVAKVFSEMIKKTDRLLICTLNESFNLEDVDPELVIDVIILKTFDALTSYEQLLLKCSAILGDVFPRDMLLYIMSSSAIRTTALGQYKEHA